MYGGKKLALLACLVLLIIVVDRHFEFAKFLGDAGYSAFLEDLKTEHILLAALAYVGLTAVGCVALALPGAAFAILAGLVFGPVVGTVLCSLATTLGAAGAFLAGRFFLRDSIKPRIAKNRYLNRLLFSETGNKAILVLMVTRLVPLFPYNLQNFAYGITNIRFWPYTFYSFLFMLPGTAMFTVGAAGFGEEENRVACFLIALSLALLVFGLGWFFQKKLMKEELGVRGG